MNIKYQFYEHDGIQATVSSLTESRFVDLNIQLKDQIAYLNRRLNQKEKEVQYKDQQVSGGSSLQSTAHINLTLTCLLAGLTDCRSQIHYDQRAERATRKDRSNISKDYVR